MQGRIGLAVLSIALCATPAPGYVGSVGEVRTADCQSGQDADIDVACIGITIPPQTIDYNTAFTPQVQVRNNRYTVYNVPVRFVIVSTSDPTDTVYQDTTHIGAIGYNQTHLVDFTLECTPDPGLFTMTGITEMPGDTYPPNDTCAKALLVREVDVATHVSSPGTYEEPGLVEVAVRLTNVGSVPAMVPRIDVTIQPSGYHDYEENIVIGVGSSQSVGLIPWVCPAGCHETCTAYITYSADMDHSNDTDIVFVNPTGIQGRVEIEHYAGMSLTLSPSPFTGNVLHIEYGLNRAGAASVALFDISGRPVLKRSLGTADAGRVSLDLRKLSAGVYLVQLDDGPRSSFQKLVVQR